MLWADSNPAHAAPAASGENKLRPQDRAVHSWYRFVLSFPPHLVQNYLSRFAVKADDTVLDPFCGTGTTLVECKKQGVGSAGLESNPIAHFASAVKVDWLTCGDTLVSEAEQVAQAATKQILSERLGREENARLLEADGMPSLFSEGAVGNGADAGLRRLEPEQMKLLLKDSISPLPLHKTLTLLEAIDGCGSPPLRKYGRLALANALVQRIGNLKFGPEVGVGRIRGDAPVVEAWLAGMKTIVHDLAQFRHRSAVASQVVKSDARQAHRALAPRSIDAVITSPPYPNEKDYTRATRLESVVLGLVRSRAELRQLKQGLVRSNTRGVYVADTDDQAIAGNQAIDRIAEAIEQRRIDLGKTSGFERQYARVTRLYFGGMAQHFASLREALKPGAKLAYVVGDQASYLRVMIRTGQLLAEIAESLGYAILGIDLFRTRPSTVTGEQLREEVIVMEWPGK
ncbi:MAG: DNA methyltransferase [Gammaproteobacteria bacterium]|nr:DNA methyltransferase [Gammaproteobacteria bacterium]